MSPNIRFYAFPSFNRLCVYTIYERDVQSRTKVLFFPYLMIRKKKGKEVYCLMKDRRTGKRWGNRSKRCWRNAIKEN